MLKSDPYENFYCNLIESDASDSKVSNKIEEQMNSERNENKADKTFLIEETVQDDFAKPLG